jgi:hypothetical protein
MKQPINIRSMVFDGLGFVFFGTIYVLIVSGILTDYEYGNFSPTYGLDFDQYVVYIAPIWIFSCLAISFVLGNLFFSKTLRLRIWIFIIITSSVGTIVFQKYGSLFLFGDRSSFIILSYFWIPKLIIILIPFTLLYANRTFFLNKIRRRNSLP